MPIVGREFPADVIISAPQVSARHAEIRPLGGGRYEIVDLGSSNGTWVNGERVQRSPLGPGDHLRLGSFVVSVPFLLSEVQRLAAGSYPAAPSAPPATAGWRPPAAPIPSPAPAPPPGPSRPVPPPAAPPPPPAETTSRVPASANEDRRGEPGLGSELAVALAAQKSYGGKAFFTWFLYWVGWLPGVVMNFVYLSDAKGVARLTGRNPNGMGCLWFLLITHFLLPLAGILFLLATGASILGSIFG